MAKRSSAAVTTTSEGAQRVTEMAPAPPPAPPSLLPEAPDYQALDMLVWGTKLCDAAECLTSLQPGTGNQEMHQLKKKLRRWAATYLIAGAKQIAEHP